MKRLTKSQYEMIAKAFHEQKEYYSKEDDFKAIRVLQDMQTKLVREFEKSDNLFDRNKFCI